MPRGSKNTSQFPRLFAFRTDEELGGWLDDCVASFPGKSTGEALREFFSTPDVKALIRRRSSAMSALRALAEAPLEPGDA